MDKFNVGETVFAVCRTYNWDTNVLQDPSAPPVVQVADKDGDIVLSPVTMGRSEVGVYFFPINTSSYDRGKYRVKYTITDGIEQIKTIHYDEFMLGR